MKELIDNWDNFWSAGHKDITVEIRRYIKSDQGKITFNLLKEYNPKDKILEAGCGFGCWIFILSKIGFDVYGIDISQSSLELAKQHSRDVGLKYKLLLSDLRKIPIKDNFFDVVVSYGAIEHFPDSHNALREFYRVLRPGGACLITTPNPYNLHWFIGRHILNLTKSKWLGYVGYEDAYTPKQLEGLLKKCNFSNIKYGILPRGFGCIFGSFWWGLPLIGKPLYNFLEKIAFFIQKGQNIFGGGSFAIGYKEEQYNK